MRNANDTVSTSELGRRITDDGIAAHGDALAAVAHTAMALGVRPGAAAALLDPTTPDVVRERAFAVVAMGLATWSADSTTSFTLVA